jgi:hypothetical protein
MFDILGTKAVNTLRVTLIYKVKLNVDFRSKIENYLKFILC